MQLPIDIDKMLFEKLGAIYAPDHCKVKQTLPFKEKDIKFYLGSYFPRSFVESHEIFNELLSFRPIKESFEQKNWIKILDIGSGTGGNILGLIRLCNSILPNRCLYIVSIDGNEYALKYQRDIINDAGKSSSNHIHLNQYKQKFDSKLDFERKITKMMDEDKILNAIDKFDIIMSFKFINEFYTKPESYKINQGFYYSFVNTMLNYLDDNGLLILLDLTDANEGQKYLPMIINTEILPKMQNSHLQGRIVLPHVYQLKRLWE